jgi:hypothetical protein
MLTLPRLQHAPDSRPLSDVQRSLLALVGELNGILLLDGRLIEGVVLAAAISKDIVHGLGRPLRGWIVARAVYPTTPTTIGEVPGAPDPAVFLRLRCAQAVTLSLWVF